MAQTVSSVFELDLPSGLSDRLFVGHTWLDSLSVGEPSSVDAVYSEILLKIVQGELPAGSVLTSTRLARALNVSRTPVVAALDRLVADGILQKQKNKRAIVRADSDQWLLQVHRLREIVEPPAAAFAATRITEESLHTLEKLRQMATPGGCEEWMTAARDFDYAIHLAIADYCGNLPLRNAIYKCWSYRRLSYQAGAHTEKTLEFGYRGHVAILQALANRDPETASAAMLFHLRSVSTLSTDQGIV
jgi:DNA-binding GntR family transcriptional regulator